MQLDPLDPTLIKENSKDFKILHMSNAVWAPSGYGVQSKGNLFPWNTHYDVRQIANYGLEGSMIEVNGLKIMPVLPEDNHATKTLQMIFASRAWEPDLFITLYDIWMGAYVQEHPQSPTGFVPIHPYWIPVVMVDHHPIPENTLISAREAYKIVTPTKYGVEQFERRGLRDKIYEIPFGIDTQVFQPTEDRKPLLDELYKKTQPHNRNNTLPWDTEDIFLINSNGANKDPYRKAWPRMFLALQIFLQQNPDAARITRFYTHSWMRMSRDIPHIAKTLHVEEYCRAPADYHMWQGVPTNKMALTYQCSDVYLHLSQGGGFEIPILEAMCCGIPVVVNDFIGMRELAEDHGWLIPPITHTEKDVNPDDPEEEVVVERSRYFTPLDSTVQIADAWEAAKALEKAFNNPDEGKKYGLAGRIFSMDFDWTLVNRQWYRLFEEIREEREYKPLETRKL